MALSISTLNHFSSTQLKCFPSKFNIFTSSTTLVSSSASSALPARRLFALAIPKRRRFRLVSASAASGDDNSRRASELPSLSPEVVILNVEGMMCEGCADSVKKLLESRPQVSSASVNLTEKVATVWPAPEAKTESNWHIKLGGGLAEHLTNRGFKSSLQDVTIACTINLLSTKLAEFSGRSGRQQLKELYHKRMVGYLDS